MSHSTHGLNCTPVCHMQFKLLLTWWIVPSVRMIHIPDTPTIYSKSYCVPMNQMIILEIAMIWHLENPGVVE